MQNVHFFKRKQGQSFHYYKVIGGSGKTENGYQIVINLLNKDPIISLKHNNTNDLTGTWCLFEAGTPISAEEYTEVFKRVINNAVVNIH